MAEERKRDDDAGSVVSEGSGDGSEVTRTFWDVFTPNVTGETSEGTRSTVEDTLPPEGGGGSGRTWVDPMGRTLLSSEPWLHVRSRLGGGGFGDVYKAGTRHDPVIGAYVDHVAVKMARVPAPDGSSKKPKKPSTRSERWKKRQKMVAAQAMEAGALTSIPKHQHVVTALSVHDTRRWGTLIVLPLAPYGDVRRWLGSAPSPSPSSGRSWTERLCVIMGMAYGLRHLHSLGLVHQDLKEGNVLMFEDCVCGVSDFGLVRGLDRPSLSSSSPPSSSLSSPSAPSPSGGPGGGSEVPGGVAATAPSSAPTPPAFPGMPTVDTHPPPPPPPPPPPSSTEASGSHTMSGSVSLAGGTTAYMSPEQRRGERPTVKSDMWSLGLVVWAILMWPGRVSRETPWRSRKFEGGRAVRDFIVSSLEKAAATAQSGSGSGTSPSTSVPVWWADVVGLVSGCLEVETGKRTSSRRVAVELEETWERWKGSVGEADGDVGLLEGVVSREAAGRASSEVSRRLLVVGRAKWLWSRPGEWEACGRLYEEALGWCVGKNDVLARCRLCSVYGGVGDVERSVSMGLSALSSVDGVGGMSRLSVWRVLMEECRSGAGMLGLLSTSEGVGDVGGWSAVAVEAVLVSVCRNKEKGVCSTVFGHVLDVVDGAVCDEALRGGWVLKEAARRGHVAIVRRLCGMGCVDVNRRVGSSGQTALWLACHSGEYGVVEVLLDAGADVDIGSTRTNSTPLHEAASCGHVEIVELLLESGAEVDARRTDDGSTPLYFACQEGWLDVVEVLIGGKADVNAAKTDRSTPLYVASAFGHLSVVEALLGGGADVDAATTGGFTPLYIACQNGHSSVVEALLGGGADVNAATTTGATPLYIACEKGHLSVVEALLGSGADVNAATTTGFTPLLIASQEGHLSVVEALLGGGADVNAAVTGGVTPLYIACQEGHLSVVEALLGGGADVNAAMTDGATSLFIACQKGHLSVVEALLGGGADVNAAMTNGFTPLLIASQKGHLSVVEALLGGGADVNAAMTNGATPLMVAAYFNQPPVIKALLQAGADASLKYSGGRTALDFARQEDHTAVIDLLTSIPPSTPSASTPPTAAASSPKSN